MSGGTGVFASAHLYTGGGPAVDDFAAADGEVHAQQRGAIFSGAMARDNGSRPAGDFARRGGLLPSAAKSAHTGSQTGAGTDGRTAAGMVPQPCRVTRPNGLCLRWQQAGFAVFCRVEPALSAASQSESRLPLAVAAPRGPARCANRPGGVPAMGTGDSE